jgi:TrmH family RNA methyltransferase
MKFDDAKKLLKKKYRQQLEHFLLEGEHLLLELDKRLNDLANPPVITLFLTQQHAAITTRLHAQYNDIVISEKQMLALSDTQTPQGIVACVPVYFLNICRQNAKPPSRFIYLHEIQDPGNLGTIIRTLAWFNGFGLLISPNSVDVFNAKVLRASMGALFHLPIEQDVLFESLPSRFKQFAVLDLHGQTIQSDSFGHFDCYLFGNEARGVPRQFLSELDSIPFTIEGDGQIDSLNLAMSVGMCAYRLSC